MPTKFSSSSGTPTLISAEYSAAGQIFVTRDQLGKEIYVDVEAMRVWTVEHSVACHILIEESEALAFVEQGRIDPSHVAKVSQFLLHIPLIWCKEMSGPGTITLADGAHRYVAANARRKLEGKARWYAPAYILEPDEWSPFLTESPFR